MDWTSAPNIGLAPLPQRARSYWEAHAAALRGALEAFLERERGQLPLWLVVGFGGGIAGWFALGSPSEWIALICFGAAGALFGFSARGGGRAERALGWFGLALALGCALVWARAEWV